MKLPAVSGSSGRLVVERGSDHAPDPSYPGHAIKVAATRSIEQIHPLAAIEHKIRTLVGLQYILLLVRDRVVGGHGDSFMIYRNFDKRKYSIQAADTEPSDR